MPYGVYCFLIYWIIVIYIILKQQFQLFLIYGGGICLVNDYRNPIIAEALKTYGYVNKFSMGWISWQQIIEAMSLMSDFPVVNCFRIYYICYLCGRECV